MNRITAILLVLLLFNACKKKIKEVHNHPPSEYYSIIKYPAGDIYNISDKITLPTFFNIGYIETSEDQSIKTLVLGKRISGNSKVGIKPISLFSFQIDTLTKKYIIATPTDETLDGIGSDFNSFSVSNIHLLTSIEEWFKSQCTIGTCRNFKWESEYKAYLEMTKTETE